MGGGAGDLKPLLTIGSWSDNIDDGDDVVITPSSTAQDVNVSLDADDGTSNNHTNVLIKVTRLYSY